MDARGRFGFRSRQVFLCGDDILVPHHFKTQDFEMTKSIEQILAACGLGLLVSFTIVQSYALKINTAEVNQVQGFYIFAMSSPVLEYEHLGVVTGPAVGSHEFDKLLDQMLKKARKEYPNGNALIFDGAIRQTHNTRVSVVRMKAL